MIISFIKKHFFPLLLTLTVLVIALITYKPGTIISGWDTLHPELDFDLNFKRLFFGVWREEQGLGAIAGHSHMADFPRVITMWFLHWIFPITSVRFVYLMLCLWAGPLGIYYLVRYLFRTQPLFKREFISFLTALFYLLNLSTVQQFYVPFEMFPVQYAFLSWIMLFSIRFLEGYSKKDLLLFSLFTLLATPQAYAAHLWYPFFGIYCLFLFLYFLIHKEKALNFRKSVILVLLTIAVNSFWLFPNLYFIKTSSYIPKESKQNRLYSQEYRLRNREQGYLKDVSLVKGFYFSWGIYDFDKQHSVFLMEEWSEHLKNPYILALGYSFFTAVAIGIILAFFKRETVFIALAPFFALPFVFLINHTFPFDRFFDFLLRFSLFEEALRFVFTKFSILIIFSYALYFALFLKYLFSVLHKNIIYIVTFILSLGLIFYCLPIFQGHLISEKMKISIPKEYNDFWSFMKTQEDGTVLAMPLYNFSGWQYYDWGYQGSGFIWFPLKQPILDRDFDRWSVSNEQSFREFYYALYANNTDYFEKDLSKFNISYIFWDKNIISPEIKNRSSILYLREIQNILVTLQAKGSIEQIGTFNKLTIYKVKKAEKVASIENISLEVTPSYRLNSFDPAFIEYGDYFTSLNPGHNSLYYPFRDIQTSSDRVKNDIINIDKTEKKLILQKTENQEYKKLRIPNYLESEKKVVMSVFIQGTSKQNIYKLQFKPVLPLNLSHTFSQEIIIPSGKTNSFTLTINDKNFLINKQLLRDTNSSYYVGQASIFTQEPNYINHTVLQLNPRTYFVADNSLKNKLEFPIEETIYSANDIYKLNQNRSGLEYSEDEGNIKFHTTDYQSGIYLPLEAMDPTLGYSLVFNTRNIRGLPLRICLKNSFSSTCTLYDELTKSTSFAKDYFFIPPFEQNYGYSLSIDNISYGNYESYNELKDITLIPFPYNFASQIYYYNNTPEKKHSSIESHTIQIAPFLWKIKVDNTKAFNPLIVLNQSYNSGWQAYSIKDNLFRKYWPFFDKKIENHVLVNNWANGWKIETLSGAQTIIIIFWPQYLEFLGIGLLAMTFIYIFIKLKLTK